MRRHAALVAAIAAGLACLAGPAAADEPALPDLGAPQAGAERPATTPADSAVPAPIVGAPSPAGPAAAPHAPAPYPPPSYGYPYPTPYPYPYPPAVPEPRPKVVPFHEDEPGPPGYRLGTRLDSSLLIAGGATFGSLWLVSITAGALLEDGTTAGEASPLFVPLVGPFVTMGTANPGTAGSMALLLDGIGQAVGAGMLIAGLTSPELVWIRQGVAFELQPGFGSVGMTATF